MVSGKNDRSGTNGTNGTNGAHAPIPSVGYIVMAYARVSEAFITNEMYLLERMGLKLHIFSVKPFADEAIRHASVKQIRAPVFALPDLTATGLAPHPTWRRLRTCWRGHMRLLRLRPARYVATLGFALGLYFRYRFLSVFRNRRLTEEQFVLDFLRAGLIALRVLETPGIRHLHAHFCHGPTTVTMMVSHLTGIPYSFTAHAKDIYLGKFNPGDLLQRKIRRAAFVVTCTEANRNHLQRVCPDLKSLHRIYHGIDTAIFAPRPANGNGHASLPTILAAGRFVEKKGFPYLVRACAVLAAMGHSFRCELVGEPDRDSEPVRRAIAEAKLEGTVFVHGALPHDQLRQVYERCTIFCLPCVVARDGDRDGIPNVLVEAMAMGIPVVSTPVSAIPELVEDGVNGLLVPQRDADALAGALERLLTDAPLRARLGRAGQEKVRRSFDAERTTRDLQQLFVNRLEAGVRA